MIGMFEPITPISVSVPNDVESSAGSTMDIRYSITAHVRFKRNDNNSTLGFAGGEWAIDWTPDESGQYEEIGRVTKPGPFMLPCPGGFARIRCINPCSDPLQMAYAVLSRR